jgi:hypothetical protein
VSIKLKELDADHWHPPNAEVKNVQSFAFILYTSIHDMVLRHGNSYCCHSLEEFHDFHSSPIVIKTIKSRRLDGQDM